MNRQTTLAGKHQVQTEPERWVEIDASGEVLGRLAARIAVRLQGKHRPEYTPHVDCGDFVVVTNCANIVLTGNKPTQKFMKRFSGHPSGQKYVRYDKVLEQMPERLVYEAVRRMVPKSKLGTAMLKKLKVYPGAEHPHSAQKPVLSDVKTFAALPEA